jgi:peptide/nickel transport system substrate-binding protein
VRFVDDPNTMIANILGGAVDVVLPPGVGMQNAVEIKRRWEGTNNQVVVGLTAGLEQVEFQHRPEYARPTDGITIRQVRQALFHAIDRATLVEVATHGLAPPADSWLRPDDPIRPQVGSAIPQYPYDPGRAQQLLAQGGWSRGADGALTHTENRERFELEIRAREAASEQGMNIVADQWKAVGVQSTLLVVPPSRRQDIEYEATRPGVLISNPRGDSLYGDRLHSRTLATAASRWQGSNKAGYSNTRADGLFDQLALAIAPSQRIALQREALREVFDDLAIIPLFWEIQPILALGSVRGRLGGTEPAWNIVEWDKIAGTP